MVYVCLSVRVYVRERESVGYDCWGSIKGFFSLGKVSPTELLSTPPPELLKSIFWEQ